MKQFLTILRRELALFRGNKVMVSLFVGAPVILGFIYGIIYKEGKLSNLPIIVIDKDHSTASATLIDMLDDNDALHVKYIATENINIEDRLIADGLFGAVLIPANFEHNLLQRRYSEINSYVNNTNMLSSGYVNRGISGVIATFNAVTSAKTGRPAEPVKLNAFRLFNTSSNYMKYIYPSYLAIFLQAVLLVVVAMSFASESENKNFMGLRQMKQSTFTLMTGKLSLYWILASVMIGIYGLYFYLFRQQYPLHLEQAILITMLFIASLGFQGTIAGLLIRSQLRAIQFLMILNMPAYITSGFSWPFEHDGLFAQIYGVLFPFMPFINGFRILLVENGSLSDIQEFLQLQILQVIIYFLIAWVLLRYRLRQTASATVNVHT